MNEWPAAIWASISAMTAALVLSLIFVLGSFARQAVEIQQVDENAVAIVKEYRRYSPYDGTTNLVPADVITAIAETRGQPEIWVDTLAGAAVEFNWKWTNNSPKELFKTDYLTDIFKDIGRYDAHIAKDLNGVVERIEFRRQ
ncbi:hypothetical protein [Paenibacillus sinopodophylli]|uniref:hypothetical protein n=1 Tax=Paenibacillus sinopodophylli TaxID=1837342 RepID=UPI00110CBED6|nr:hypothetical protein [Paenibacillus sinopodophylli]